MNQSTVEQTPLSTKRLCRVCLLYCDDPCYPVYPKVQLP